MAAPTLTARGTPAGFMLENGFVSKIAFARLPTVSFWEKSVQPPSIDGGDPVDITTMFNTKVTTKTPNSPLYDMGACVVVAAYDPNCLTQIRSTLINQPGGVSNHYPDGTTDTWWGFLQKAEPSVLVRGEPPEITLTIMPTNYDPANNVEAEPVLASVAGT